MWVGFFGILYVTILLYAIYYYYTLKFEFWKKRKVIGPKPELFFGTMKNVILQRTSSVEYYKEIYMTYKDAPLVGIFNQTKPILLINDFSLIKDVLSDVAVFSGRGYKIYKKAEPLSVNLLYMKGKVPLQMRAKLSTIFTPSKLKGMFSLLLQREEIFKNWLDTLLSQNEEIDCKIITERLVADYTATCIFGYDIITGQNLENNFLQDLKKFTKGDSLKNMLKFLLPDVYDKIYDLIGYYVFDNSEITERFVRFVKDILSYRKKHNIFKHDLVSVLTELEQKKLIEEIEFTDSFFAAQLLLFFLASFETSSVTICNTLYELALNHNIQNRLREEIKSLFTINGEITFEAVMAMPYLDAIYKETLRKYPPIDTLGRESSSAYTFKNSKVTIPKDQLILIPVYGIHFNPEIYPKPEIYDPERFISKGILSKQVLQYIPFGYGPRNCIGERFAILEVKVGLINLVQNYKFDICKRTQKIYSAEILVQQPKDVYLKVTKI